jgi:hypothetical protein
MRRGYNYVTSYRIICPLKLNSVHLVTKFHLLWNSEDYFRAHKSPPQIPILSHMSSVHTLLTSHLRLALPSYLFPSDYPTKTLKMAAFWVVAPCRLVSVYRRFRGLHCLHHQGPCTRRHKLEEGHLHNHRRENLKSY